MIKFEVGQCYFDRSICDHNCIFSYLVVKRTEKSVTLQNQDGKIIRRKLRVDNKAEYCSPEGDYSMAPTLCADSILPGEGQNLKERTEILRRAARQEEADSQIAWRTAQQINNLFSVV